MKRTFCSLFAIISLTLLNSCAPPSVLLQQNYAGKNIDEASLAIVIADKHPNIQYEGNPKPEFGEGDPEQLIMSFFKKQLPIDIKARTTLDSIIVVDTEVNHDITYTTRELEVWKAGFFFHHKIKLNVKVPSTGQKFQISKFDPQFVLIIDNLIIGTDYGSSVSAPVLGPNGWAPGGTTSTKNLNYISDFAIWDNTRAELVSFGHIEESAEGIFWMITKDTWMRVSSRYVTRMFAQSPFIKPEYDPNSD
jgi:hypothetical protein